MNSDREAARPVGRPQSPTPDDLEMLAIDAAAAIARYRDAKRKVNNERPR